MSSSAPKRPPGGEPTATLIAWGRRLWTGRRSTGSRPQAAAAIDPLLESGRRLRAAREARGLSLRQLALDTRISTAVLEALEKGWRERLPEPTYLRTMLALLEQHLELESGTLEAALPPRQRQGVGPRAGGPLRRFPLTSIEVFGTWQGVLLYACLCLGLLYGLNREQQRLAARGLFSLRPIPALPVSSSRQESRGDSQRAGEGLLQAHPDLRPLEQARRGQALLQLRRQLQPPRPSVSAATTPTRSPGGSAPAAAGGAPQPNP